MGKGFKMGGGGASPLNFKVVGGAAAPESPRENMIWVETDTEISGWAISPKEPESPAEGLVWVITGLVSQTTFNALKKNELRICPLKAKQYVGGAWVEKTAKSYVSGEWVSWWDGSTIYGNGKLEFISGMTTAGYMSFSNSGSALWFTVPAWQINHGIAYSNEPVDLTGKSKVKINVVSGSYVYNGSFNGFGIAKSIPSVSGNTVSGVSARRDFGAYSVAGNYELDVSSLSGTYYIVFFGRGMTEKAYNLAVDSITLE